MEDILWTEAEQRAMLGAGMSIELCAAAALRSIRRAEADRSISAATGYRHHRLEALEGLRSPHQRNPLRNRGYSLYLSTCLLVDRSQEVHVTQPRQLSRSTIRQVL